MLDVFYDKYFANLLLILIPVVLCMLIALTYIMANANLWFPLIFAAPLAIGASIKLLFDIREVK